MVKHANRLVRIQVVADAQGSGSLVKHSLRQYLQAYTCDLAGVRFALPSSPGSSMGMLR